MGARRLCAAAPPATAAPTTALRAKKKNASSTDTASPPHDIAGSTGDTTASATNEASPLATTQVTVDKTGGKKKRTKQSSCTEQSSEESPSSCAARVRSDSDSTGEPGRKTMKQRVSTCDRDNGDHIFPVVAATPATPAGDDGSTEREKKRRKREPNAATSRVSSTNNNGGSTISEGTSKSRGGSTSSSSSVCSDSSDSSDSGDSSDGGDLSDSSSTCCSSSANPLFVAPAKKKEKESLRKEKSSCYISGDEEEKEKDDDSCVPGVTATSVAPEGKQQQGSQLSAYKLTAQTLAVLQQRGIQQLLPIQAATFASVYSGKDLIGRADTGTGKTLAFALPLVERLLSCPLSSSNSSSVSGERNDARGVRLLVLLPTRELAQQVHAEFVLLLQGRMLTACVYGGGNAAAASRQQQYRWQNNKSQQGGTMQGQLQQQQQLENLRRGRCGVLVGCPGRVKDLINRGYLGRGAAIQSVVMDEADRLLDMGFREDVEEILQWCRDAWKQANAAPATAAAGAEERKKTEGQEDISTHVPAAAESCKSSKNTREALQFLLFTATLPHWARGLASRFMRPDRLVVDASTLNNGTNPSGASNKTSDKIAMTGSSPGQPQQQNGNNQGITYMVLFCPWKNRVRVLEDVLTVYAGYTGAHLPGSTLPSSSPGASSSSGAAGVGGSSAAIAAAAGDGVDVSNGGGQGARAGAAAVIFAETKQQVNEIALESGLRRLAAPLHGDLPQQQRETTLHAFKSGCFPYLVATDVAARGLHVDGLPLVVQLSPPRDLDSFVHRAGRTGRAGKAGICLTFAAIPDIPMLLTLEKKLRMQFKRVGVPQPAGIQKRLLDLQLRWILPSTVAAEDSSSITSSSRSSCERGQKRLRHEDCEEAQGSIVETETDTEESKMDGDADEKDSSTSGRKSGAPLLEEETRQIFDAADRVLHALSPHEAVRRCLALLLRHAGTACGSQNQQVVDTEACSAPSTAATGAGQGKERLSCLSGREGLRTYVLVRKGEHEMEQHHQDGGGSSLLRSPGEVWRLLKGALLHQKRGISEGRGYSDRSSASDEVVEDLLERIQSLTLTADGKGAVFDVATVDIPAFEAHVLRRCRKQQPVEEIPFTIREVEELPELVDLLASRRSEQGGGRSSMQYVRNNDFRSPWKSGGRDSNERNRGGRGRGGGGYHNHYNDGGGPGMQQRSETWTSRGRGGRGGGRGRGGGGGLGISRGRREFASNRGRGGYHHGDK